MKKTLLFLFGVAAWLILVNLFVATGSDFQEFLSINENTENEKTANEKAQCKECRAKYRDEKLARAYSSNPDSSSLGSLLDSKGLLESCQG